MPRKEANQIRYAAFYSEVTRQAELPSTATAPSSARTRYPSNVLSLAKNRNRTGAPIQSEPRKPKHHLAV